MIEVLETSQDNLDEQEAGEKAGVVRDESDTDSNAGRDDNDSSTDDDSEGEDGHSSKNEDSQDGNSNDKDSHGLVDKYRERRRTQKVQHRQHRGVMQFRVPRTAQWAKHKGERVQDKVAGLFKHHTREAGVETEV